MKDLTFSYPNIGKSFDLGPITLNIPAFSTTLILGTSGSGKSTLLDLICKLNEPSSGRVDFRSTSGDLLEQLPSIGYVSQRSSLFGANLIENIGFAKPNEMVDSSLAMQVINALNLTELSEESRTSAIRSDGTDISGGERQRISMARVLYLDPEMVILDEPTSSLDSINKEKIYSFLREIQRKKTVIVVTHETELIEYCDFVIQMENGKVQFQGTAKEFIKQKTKSNLPDGASS